MHANHVEHRLAIRCIAGKRPHALGNPRGLVVGLAGHQSRDGAAKIAAGVGIVRHGQRHQQRAEIGVAEAQRAKVVRILRDAVGRIAGVIHQNFLRGDGHVHGVAESFNVELIVRAQELQQIERSQIAGRVVEEHIFRARIRSVDAIRGLAGVPAIDRGVVLHAGIAALPRGFGHAVQQFAGAEFLGGLAVGDVFGPPIAIVFGRLHEFIGDADGVIRVLEENRGIGFAVDRGIVTVLDQRVRLAFFLYLAVDEFGDVRMIHIQDHHLGGAARLAAALDDAGEGIETLHEAHRTGSDSAAG